MKFESGKRFAAHISISPLDRNILIQGTNYQSFQVRKGALNMKTMKFRLLVVLLVTVLVSTSIPAYAFVSNHGQTFDAAANVITVDETKAQTAASQAQPNSSDDYSEFIETSNELAGTVQAYFENSDWHKYIVDNSNMSLKYTVSKDQPQYLDYIQNSQKQSYIENTMDVFVKMTDGKTVYASTSSENAIVNMYRHGYYYDEVRFEGQNFAEEVEGLQETALDIFSQRSKHSVRVTTNYSNGSWLTGGTKTSITLKVTEEDDPYVRFSETLSVDTSHNYVYITMTSTNVSAGAVYVKIDGGEYKSIVFNIFPDGVEHTYKIDLTKISGYTEGSKLTAFRLDLDKYALNDTVDIKSIKFVNGVEGGIKNLYLANIFHVYSDKLHYEMQLAASEAVNNIEEIGVKTEIPTGKVAKIIVADKNGEHSTLDGVDWNSVTYVGFDTTNAGVFGIILPIDKTTGKLNVTVENGNYVIVYSRTPFNNQILPGSGSADKNEPGVGNVNDFYMGYRIHTDETHDFAELKRQARFERQPLDESQIVIDYANSDDAAFLGYDGVRGSYMFKLVDNTYRMYDNFRNKHFALNFTINNGDGRLAYFVVGTDNSLLECSVVLNENLMLLPVPIEVGKNFCGDGDENIFDKLDIGYSEAILPIIADADAREYTVLHLYENWGDFQLKQISFIEFTTAYYHLSTGTVESNCLVPWGWTNNRAIPGFMPDHRGMSGTEWPGSRTHQQAGSHSFFRYSDSYYEELTHQDIDSYGPTYVDYTSEYLTDDGKIKTTRRHLEYSDLDENRTYYMFEYEALQSVTLSKENLQFYSVATNDEDDPYKQFGYLDSSNNSKTNTFANIGAGVTKYYTLGSNKPYFSIFDRTSVNYANVSLIIDSCSVIRSNGTKENVQLAIRCKDGRVSLTLNADTLTLNNGDKITLNAMLLPWGSEESDYSGTTYAPDQNVRDVRENTLLNPVRIAAVENCTVTENHFMYKLQTTNGESATFTISGGKKNTTDIPYREGYHTVPVRIYGFEKLSVPVVYEKKNGEWVKHDISSADNLDGLGYGAYYDGYNVYYEEDGTYSYSFVIDVTDAQAREFKVELVENFTGFEKIKGEDLSVVYEEPMNVFVDYQDFGGALWKEWFGRVSTNYEDDGSGYISLYPLHTGGESVISELVVNNERNITGQYMVLKYRLPVENAHNSEMLFQFFLSTQHSVKDIRDPADKLNFGSSILEADGEWHTLIVDLASYTDKWSFAADSDGQHRVQYVRFDPFNGIADTNKEFKDRVDVAYFALHDDLSDICTFDENADNFTIVLNDTAHIATKVVDNKVDASEQSDGSYDLTVSCSCCSTAFVDETIITPAIGYSTGDVNGDNCISTMDLFTMFLYISNPEVNGLTSEYAADVNRDGSIDNADVLLMFKHIYSPVKYPLG